MNLNSIIGNQTQIAGIFFRNKKKKINLNSNSKSFYDWSLNLVINYKTLCLLYICKDKKFSLHSHAHNFALFLRFLMLCERTDKRLSSIFVLICVSFVQILSGDSILLDWGCSMLGVGEGLVMERK